jgi:hypothetical protein
MLLHGYNPSDGSFTGTSKFSNPVMEKAQKGNATIVDDFDFAEAADLYETDGATFTLIEGWEAIKAERNIPPDVYPDTQSARAAMLGFIERLTDQVTSQYPKAEVSAWPSKAEAARAVIAEAARADQVALIQDEADIVGATLADQAAAIVAKAVVFEAIVAKVSGLRQATDKALVLATTSAEREAVLDAATVQANDLATAYGLAA